MFKTAKHWGHGPLKWTATELWSENFIANSEYYHHHQSNPLRPSALCGSSVHVYPGNEWSGSDSESDWPNDVFTCPMEHRIRESLKDNDFSRIGILDLPLNVQKITKVVDKSPDELFKETLIFAIVGRNIDLITTLLQRAHEDDIEIESILPLHLATTYLDGSIACCNILRFLFHYDNLRPETELMPNDRNSLGHTVLDNLMVTVLRNHTVISPKWIDLGLTGTKSFPGEEIDICGRWDADSDCYLSLVTKGHTSIPLDWKHKFCHTSIQAVSHCILTIGSYGHLDFVSGSGLFIRHCSSCGMKLQPRPLHSLVFTAFLLAEKGCAEEDLFGMIYVLLSLTVAVTDDERFLLEYVDSAELSINLLQTDAPDDGCSHQSYSPAQLAHALGINGLQTWSHRKTIGWKCFCYVLQRIEDQYQWACTGQEPPGSGEDQFDDIFDILKSGDIFDMFYEDQDTQPDMATKVFGGDGVYLGYPKACDHRNSYGLVWRVFGRDRLLGHIWASAQCEVLAYRRMKITDTWHSEYLDTETLLRCLEMGDPTILPSVAKGMMKKYCSCGFFIQIFRPCLWYDACSDRPPFFFHGSSSDATTFLLDCELADDLY
jgi:hypothetical protein